MVHLLAPLLSLAAVAASLVGAAPIVTPRAASNQSSSDFLASRSGTGTSGTLQAVRVLGKDVVHSLALANLKSALQYTYSTYDPINKRQYTTPATVLLPSSRGLYSDDTNPIMVYALAYDSASAACGPSYQIANRSLTTAETIFVGQALLSGVTVVLPDYEGPLGAFNVGPLSGNSLLDSIRALLVFKEAVPDKRKAKVVMKGYSGGSVPVAWAVQQQPSYAPELLSYLKGASMGGIPTMPSSTLKALNGGQYSTLVLSALAAYSNVFSSISSWVDARLTPAGKAAMADAEQLCTADNLTAYANTDVFQKYVGTSVDNAMADPTLQSVLDSLVLANGDNFGMPQVPLFVYSSKEDDTVPHVETQRYVDALCSRGVKSLEYQQIASGGHAQTEVLTGPTASFTFLSARLSGFLQPATGCNATLFNPPAKSGKN